MSTEVDSANLRRFYERIGCPGVVSLIDYLNSPEAKGLVTIGSSTIDPELLGGFTVMHLGQVNGPTPMQTLEFISKHIPNAPESRRQGFDLVAMATAKPVGNVDIYNQDGAFKVPVEHYHDEMTLAELEPFRTRPASKR